MDIVGKPKNTIASYTLQQVESLPGKAEIFPGTGVIQVDKKFWSRLSDIQKRMVLAHELAHDEDPNASEEETDRRAGARARWEGISAKGAVEALASIVGSRRAGAPVIEGWRAADAYIRDRKTQHESSDLTNPEGQIGGDARAAREMTRPPQFKLDADGQSFEPGFEDDDAQQSVGIPDVELVNGGTTAKLGSPFSHRAPSEPAPPPKTGASHSVSIASMLVIGGVIILAIAIVRSAR